jgi:carbonic anhydrase/acetyltransferase-like protein (isoleucine patch superfamily)
VFIGANSKIYDARIESFAFIGPASIVHSGAVVEGYGMVAAGSNVVSGTVVQSGQVYAGSPAKYLRDLT